MRHIRFMSTNDTVCEKPTRLGYDFVIQERATDFGTEFCKECSTLLAAHNKREYEREGTISLAQQHNRIYDPRPWFEGVVTGLALATGWWVAIFVLIWWVWFR